MDVHIVQHLKKINITVCLIGQPNCGKSTIFNAFAGYKSAAVNFPGSTVNFAGTVARVGMNRFNFVDLSGTYSLYPADEAEKCTRDYLFNNKVDLVVIAVDAPRLERGLGFLFEVMKQISIAAIYRSEKI